MERTREQIELYYKNQGVSEDLLNCDDMKVINSALKKLPKPPLTQGVKDYCKLHKIPFEVVKKIERGRFIGSGSDGNIFISKDGEIVIKIFKMPVKCAKNDPCFFDGPFNPYFNEHKTEMVLSMFVNNLKSVNAPKIYGFDSAETILYSKQYKPMCEADINSCYTLLQIFHFIHLLQSHQISHNDLTLSNIMCEPNPRYGDMTCTSVVNFVGKNFTFVLPLSIIPFFVKIIDYGRSMKFSTPEVYNTTTCNLSEYYPSSFNRIDYLFALHLAKTRIRPHHEVYSNFIKDICCSMIHYMINYFFKHNPNYITEDFYETSSFIQELLDESGAIVLEKKSEEVYSEISH
jgi:hypothetical protein